MYCLYIANMIDAETYREFFRPTGRPVLAANRYHTLLCEGLAANNVDVCAVAVIPANRSNFDGLTVHGKDVRERGILYHYPTFFLFPGIKHAALFTQAFIAAMLAPRDSVVLYDGLAVSASYGACLAAKLRGFKRLCIVTDLPEFFKGRGKLLTCMNRHIINLCSGYLFLTRYMNERVNYAKKPFLIVEGHTDQSMERRSHKAFHKAPRKVVYAGTCAAEYGLDKLCDAFILVSKASEELHVYGNGDYAEELTRLSDRYSNIFYHGTRLNSEIVDAELEATLLVNPRPATEEYTRYSFPSKTMEYMASGTPVAMTHLPGMPDEYCDYVYLFDSGSAADIAKKLREILDKPAEELEAFGAQAKKFVMENKTNVKQAEKILRFIKDEL